MFNGQMLCEYKLYLLAVLEYQGNMQVFLSFIQVISIFPKVILTKTHTYENTWLHEADPLYLC
jgi:hypothetical protein